VLCGNDGPGKLAALWAALNGLDHVDLPDPGPHESDYMYRNAAILIDASAFVAFRSVEGWPHFVEDLVLRAKGRGRQVQVVGGIGNLPEFPFDAVENATDYT
jgi:hypothetical protein